jgi:TonB family protein
MMQTASPKLVRKVSANVTLLLASCLCALAQTQPPSTTTPDAKARSASSAGPVVELSTGAPNKIARPEQQEKPDVRPSLEAGQGMQILSETDGVDFGPYMKRLKVTVQNSWYPLVPSVALPPTMKSGRVIVEFAIMKNGDLRDMRITQSSGDIAMDRAAFGAIANARPLPVLPSEFTRDYLRVRSAFLYNPRTASETKTAEKPMQVYNQGLAEVRGQNWGNAERLMQQAVELDSTFDLAWNNLGRARMYLRKYAEAETAFRRFLALKPDDALPYAQLAWALTTEKKYAEAAELLEKRIASHPDDGDAHRRLGFVYVLMHRPEPAVPVLEKASRLLPNSEAVFYYLGLADLQAHRNDEAALAFERSIAIKGSESTLNNCAYELAKSKTHLDLAETWAQRAVSEVETELNQVTLQTVSANTTALLRRASMYWDTLGWIKFEKGDLPVAERYVRAGWELADSTTIGWHLARIYEDQQRKSEAIEAYAQTLAAIPGDRELTDDEKEARKRLATLLGREALVDARVNESRPRFKELRSVQIANRSGAEGITEYQVMVGAGAKLKDLRVVNSDGQLDELADALRSAPMPQSFPDSGILTLPRAGILTCTGSGRPCKFTLLSAGDAARSLSSAPTLEP